MSRLDYREWSRVLENTFLQFNWTKEAKIHTYTKRIYQPDYIERILFAYRDGDISTQRCRSNQPGCFVIQQKIPDTNQVFRIIIGEEDTHWTIITFYSSSARRYWDKNNKKEFSTKHSEHYPDRTDRKDRDGDISTQRCRSNQPVHQHVDTGIKMSINPIKKFFNKIKPNKKNKKEFSTKHSEHYPDRTDRKDRFIVDSVYYDDSDALLVYFTEESDDICDEATGYLLVCFNDIGKIVSIRIASPSKHIRGIASEEPSFTLNPTYDEEFDIFKINFTGSVPMTISKKTEVTEVEDVELELDDERKLITILFRNASIKMANILK
ncbi:hypothetical protein Glove_295g44 [Diversispora epigaea]|uniref:Uncharacterized protein n=1 Tax=Diversispora epigaea TaxID=1348612 RepID=A0A397I4T7_9GLOM|nr:hypothetical protein Glove_295g44 [Diversispora epigaea]